MVCNASISSKSQENGPFHRSVWQGLYLDISHSGGRSRGCGSWGQVTVNMALVADMALNLQHSFTWGQDPFLGPFMKRKETLCVCARMQHILVVNSYSKFCIHPCHSDARASVRVGGQNRPCAAVCSMSTILLPGHWCHLAGNGETVIVRWRH